MTDREINHVVIGSRAEKTSEFYIAHPGEDERRYRVREVNIKKDTVCYGWETSARQTKQFCLC